MGVGNHEHLRRLLSRLSDARGVSGDEREVRAVLREELGELAEGAKVDALGNLLVTRRFPGKGTPVRVMLAAHMDEVGLMVTHLDKSGRLRFAPVGGIDLRILPALPVLVGPDRVPGVIGLETVYREDTAEQPGPPRLRDLTIDIGCPSREEAGRWVKVGDRVTFATAAREFGDGLVLAKALDNRAGCAVLVELLKGNYPGVELAAAFTVQEEVGLRGARVAAHALAPDVGLALEGTVCADLPGVDEASHVTRLGAGPALSLMDAASVANRSMVEVLTDTARHLGIPYQFRRFAAGGNDAGAISLALEGVPTASVSVPCRYIHGPAAVAAIEDVAAAIRLVSAFLCRVGDEGLRFRDEGGAT